MFSLHNFDWAIFLIIILILSLGTVTILSVNAQLFSTQIVYVLISIVVFFLFSSSDFRIFESLAELLYLVSVFLLVIPIFFGVFSRGAIRWIQIGGLRLQPSELAKPLLIIFSAKFWAVRKFNFKNFFLYLAFISLPFLLVFMQPDLGSCLAILSIAIGIIFISDINWKQLMSLFLIVFFFLPLSWPLLKDYQKERIEHFVNPNLEPLGRGYNVLQSIITIGSGGLLGKGFGQGTQSHLAFLPERHTDFLFASFAEEFGFLGILILLFLYFNLLTKLIKSAKIAKYKFGQNIIVGIFSFIFFQTFINIGMNLGILPVTGITLPLFSYGGSSLISTMVCLGLFESVCRFKHKFPEIEIGIGEYPNY